MGLHAKVKIETTDFTSNMLAVKYSSYTKFTNNMTTDLEILTEKKFKLSLSLLMMSLSWNFEAGTKRTYPLRERSHWFKVRKESLF